MKSLKALLASLLKLPCKWRVIASTALLAITVGCKSAQPDAASTDGKTADAGAAVTGESVFRSNCSNCHAINEKGGKRAPDLGKAGEDPKHTESWLAEFIKDPKSKDPNSKMPPQGDRLKEADMKKLTAYLVSLK